jgi:ATP-binding cassette subfamily B protein
MLVRGIATAVKAGPLEATAIFVSGLIAGSSPVVVAWLQKGLVEHFTAAISTQSAAWTPFVYWTAGMLVVLAMADDAGASINVFCMTALRDKIEGVTKTRLFTRIMQSRGLDLFEDPDQLDALNLAHRSIPRYQQLDNCFASLIRGIFGTVPAILLGFTIAWWVPPLLCATVIPAGIVQFRLEGKVWNAEATLAESRRRQLLVEEVITRPAFAKDVRLFSFGALLIGRWTDVFHHNFNLINTLRLKGLQQTLVLSAISTLGIVIPLISILNGVINGTESLGNLVLYLGIGFSLRLGLQNLLWSVSELAGITLAIDHVESFLASTPSSTMPASAAAHPAPLARALDLKDVSFSYPGASTPALQSISIEIAKGSTIAIVGENGAGKSTLAKLLGRLYPPSTGAILWDGVDVSTFDLDAWRNRLGFMAQDVAEFPFTLEEYLAFSRLDDPPDQAELTRVLSATNLASVGSRSDLGLDIPLTKELPGGTQLSGGQWQRLALARVALRAPAADLLILDEPTAAVDPASEHELIDQLLELGRGRTAIIITHRLALCTEVDRVVVLHEGQVLEDGTHTDLLARGGHYANMFHAQAHRYRVT